MGASGLFQLAAEVASCLPSIVDTTVTADVLLQTTGTATADELQGTFETALDGLVKVLPNVITVGIGGLIATAGWRWWRRPELTVASDGVRVLPSAPNEQTRVYRVRIENEGRQAAENCKPRVDLEIETDGDVTDVSTLCRWAERDQPTRTTINVGEVAEFVLLEYDEHDSRVRFPGADGSGSYAKLFRYDADSGRNTDSAEPSVGVGASQLTQGTAREQRVTVTAENAGSVTGTVTFDGEDGDLNVEVCREQ
jgi:hypothetical protein